MPNLWVGSRLRGEAWPWIEIQPQMFIGELCFWPCTLGEIDELAQRLFEPYCVDIDNPRSYWRYCVDIPRSERRIIIDRLDRHRTLMEQTANGRDLTEVTHPYQFPPLTWEHPDDEMAHDTSDDGQELPLAPGNPEPLDETTATVVMEIRNYLLSRASDARRPVSYTPFTGQSHRL